MRYIIEIPDNLKPMDMLNCDTEDAVRMLGSAVPYTEVSDRDPCAGCESETTGKGCYECCHDHLSQYREAQ